MKVKIYESKGKEEQNYKLLTHSIEVENPDLFLNRYNDNSFNIFEFINKYKKNKEIDDLSEDTILYNVVQFLNNCDNANNINNIFDNYKKIVNLFYVGAWKPIFIRNLNRFINNNFDVTQLDDKTESLVLLYSNNDGINYFLQFLKNGVFEQDKDYENKTEYIFIRMMEGEYKFNDRLLYSSYNKLMYTIKKRNNVTDKKILDIIEKDIDKIKTNFSNRERGY